MVVAGSLRKLGAFDATMLVMGGIVGVGIFFTPAQVAEQAPNPWGFFALWVVGAAIAMCGAATFAELGGTFPRSGGWFEFLREIYGGFAAYMLAWVVLAVVATGAIAIVASFAASMVLGLFGDVDPRAQLGLGAAVIVGLTAITACGVKVGATFQNVCMVTKLTAIAAVVVAGVFFFAPEPSSGAAGAAAEAAAQATAPLSWKGLVAGTLPVLFAYGGWQQVCYVSGEVVEPQRTVPRAIVLGVLGAAATYLLMNFAYVRVLGLGGLATTADFAAVTAERTLGSGGGRVLRAAMAVSAVGTCAVIVIVTPAIYVSMARSGLFFRSFARLHPRTGAPLLALLAQLGIALGYLAWAHADVLVEVDDDAMDIGLLTGSVVFAEWFFHGLTAWGLIRLRARRPELPRPYKSALFPLAPALYFVTALLVVVGNVYASPRLQTGVGLAVLALGAALYRPWRRLFGGAR